MADGPPGAWRALCAEAVETPDQFTDFLDRVGICTWTPLAGVDFPNLADAMRRDGVVGETWFWKDDLHVERRLYYGHLLAGRPTFVSIGLLPALIAARGDVDPATYREQGRLSTEALAVYEALARERRLTSRELRRAAGLQAREHQNAFSHGVVALEALFQICKVGITGRTRGTYGYVWGLVEDWAPETLQAAARLRPADAAAEVAGRLAEAGVPLTAARLARWFGWDRETARSLADR